MGDCVEGVPVSWPSWPRCIEGVPPSNRGLEARDTMRPCGVVHIVLFSMGKQAAHLKNYDLHIKERSFS
ncbi:MAG: hypothetical protein WBC05_10180 [Sedimentisphaerales bacterium]